MNDNEAIDRVIALLEKLRPQKKPREFWCVMDRDGDTYCRCDARAEAEEKLPEYRSQGDYGPYTLAHIVEVIE